MGLLKRRKIDFTDGPLFGRMLIFIFPIILSNALQTLYTTADQLIVGHSVASIIALVKLKKKVEQEMISEEAYHK